MKTLHLTVAFIWFVLGGSPLAFGQPVAPGPELSAAVAAAQQPYNQAFASHPQLLNGPEYLDYSKRYHARTGHPFFLVPEVQAGSVAYNGHQFADVRLAYDLVLDQLALMPPNSPLLVRLINEKVAGFTISGHRFIRLEADSTTGRDLSTHFYEVLFDSSTVQVLAKHTKRLQEHINQQFIDVEFTGVDKLFLKKDGRYFAITSKGSAVRPFADHAREMQQYAQAHQLRFGRDQRAASTVQLAAYYCSLAPR